MFGLENSFMHSDEFQEQHKKDVKGTVYVMSFVITSREGRTYCFAQLCPLLFHTVSFLPSLVPYGQFLGSQTPSYD